MRIKSAFAAPFLLIVVLALLAVSAGLDPAAAGANPYLTLIILELIVYAVPSLFFCRLRGSEYTKRLRLRLFHPNHLIFMLLAWIVMAVGCALLNWGMYTLFPAAGVSGASDASAHGANGYAVLAYCLFPAITEEFLFRGILTAEYESVSVPFAILMTSVCFAAMHLNYARFPAYLFSGIVLALVLYATRSILAPMLVHALHNVTALWTDRYLLKAVGTPAGSGVLLAFLMLSVLFIALVLLFLEGERIYTGYGVTATPSPYVRRRKKNEPGGVLEALAAPPFILFIVLTVIFSVVTA